MGKRERERERERESRGSERVVRRPDGFCYKIMTIGVMTLPGVTRPSGNVCTPVTHNSQRAVQPLSWGDAGHDASMWVSRTLGRGGEHVLRLLPGARWLRPKRPGVRRPHSHVDQAAAAVVRHGRIHGDLRGRDRVMKRRGKW